jgi:hypothetical protein
VRAKQREKKEREKAEEEHRELEETTKAYGEAVQILAVRAKAKATSGKDARAAMKLVAAGLKLAIDVASGVSVCQSAGAVVARVKKATKDRTHEIKIRDRKKRKAAAKAAAAEKQRKKKQKTNAKDAPTRGRRLTKQLTKKELARQKRLDDQIAAQRRRHQQDRSKWRGPRGWVPRRRDNDRRGDGRCRDSRYHDGRRRGGAAGREDH